MSEIWRLDKTKNIIEFPTSEEIFQFYADMFTSIFPGISTDLSTPQGQLITSLVSRDLEVINFCNHIVNYFFAGGEGEMLDHWAWNLFRSKRRPQAMATVEMQINGARNTVIDKGFQVSDGNITFESIAPILIDDTGIAKGEFKSTTFTTDVAKANTITQIITPLVHVHRVSNTLASSPGVPLESDTALYGRCITQGSLFKNTSLMSILSNIAQLPGVLKLQGHENISAQEITYRGTKLAPHSIALVIHGGSPSEIGDALLYSKPVGTATNGDQDAKATFGDYQIIYKFFRPTLVALKAQVSIVINVNTPSDIENMLKTALIDYINNVKIGATIAIPHLACAISLNCQNCLVTDIQLSKKTGTLGYSKIELNFVEMASIDAVDIEIKK